MLHQGPFAGYEAEISCFRLPSGDWEVCLALTNDVHGRPDEYHHAEHPDCMSAYGHRDRLQASIDWAKNGPLITPITA